MNERLEIRLSDSKKKLLKEASDLVGVTVTGFILRVCISEAKKIVSRKPLIGSCDNRQLDMFRGIKDE